MEKRTIRAYMLSMLLLALFLLGILIGYEVFPVTNGYDDLLVEQQASLQITRGEYIETQVLILEYRPALKSQAIGGLQSVLPTFQQVQTGLLHGNASYGLPGNPPGSVSTLLQDQGDYTALLAATSRILATPDTVPDPLQVNIIVQHTQAYAVTMYQVASLLQQDAETRRIQILLIKLALIAGVSACVVLKYVLLTRRTLEEIQ